MKRIWILCAITLISCSPDSSDDLTQLSQQIVKKFTLTTSSTAGGSVNIPGGEYIQGEKVILRAIPDSGFSFTSWSNGSTDNPVTITINANTTITANFDAIPTYEIVVSAGEGGTVSTNGGQYSEGSEFSVTATPNQGYYFTGWSNGSLESNINLIINGEIELIASFQPIEYSIPTNFNLESTYLSPETYYSITLSWDENDSEHISSVNIYKGINEDELQLFESVEPNTYTFKDNEVSVRIEYFYKISYQYGDYEHDKTSIKSLFPFEPENNLIAPTNFPMPRGIHYAYQYFDKNTFESVKHRFTIHQEPSNNGKLYYQFYNGRINDTIGFYYGIQTDVYSPISPYNRGRGLIFSRWKTRDIENYSLAPNGWGQSAGYEGDFIGVRNSYNWEVGTYETELKKDSTDNIGDWYSLKIRNVLENEQTYIGSIRFELSSVSSGIKSGGSLWTELYSNAADGTIPDWHVSVDDISIDDNEKPNRIYTTYNETFEGFSNIYTTNKNDVHFLVGPKVKKITPGGWFYWDED